MPHITLESILSLSLKMANQRLDDKKYLNSVKSMDYPTFLNTMKIVAPDIEALQLLSNFYTEYMVFTNTKDEKQMICDMVDEYPISIIEKNGSYQFQGLTPSSFKFYVPNNIIYLPIVVDIDGYEYTHQMTLIIDFHKGIAFVHNPNGFNCRYYNKDVRDLFVVYVKAINHVFEAYSLKQITLIDNPRQAEMNFQLKWIGNGHCVVSSIAYMIAYKNVGNVDSLNQALFHTSKKKYYKLYTALYNHIGKILLDA